MSYNRENAKPIPSPGHPPGERSGVLRVKGLHALIDNHTAQAFTPGPGNSRPFAKGRHVVHEGNVP